MITYDIYKVTYTGKKPDCDLSEKDIRNLLWDKLPNVPFDNQKNQGNFKPSASVLRTHGMWRQYAS